MEGSVVCLQCLDRVLSGAAERDGVYEEPVWGGGEVMAVERSWAIYVSSFWTAREWVASTAELDDAVNDLGVAPLGNPTGALRWCQRK